MDLFSFRNRFLEEELDRLRRNQLTENLPHREIDLSGNDSSKDIEELRLRVKLKYISKEKLFYFI